MDKRRSKIIGIDLGTTNSCVSVMEGSTPIVIANAEGARTTPSVVSYKDKDRLVGVQAKRQAITNPERTIFSSKRFIGRKFTEVSGELENVPYKVVAGKDGGAAFEIDGKVLTPEEVGAQVLIKMKETAEAYLDDKVSEVVITVPAYFNDAQRQSTKDAGRIAGLEVKRIINEPTAAALAYGLEKHSDKKIAVYDLGGGTFDISILEMGEGVFEVLATNGDTHLGGDDFDLAIMHWLIDEFKKEHGIDLRKDKMALQRLRDAAEKAKIELSGTVQTDVNQPFITMDAQGPKHLQLTLNRSTFESLTQQLIDRTREPSLKCLKDAGLTSSQIDEVILVGGMTRMPAIQTVAREIFDKEPHKGVNPDEVVAIGAAIQGGVLTGDVKDVVLLDVTPLSLGIETMGGVMTKIIERNTTIPAQKKMTFSTAADNQPAVTIRVLQGEREMAADNKDIERFDLTDIPPAPRGVPQIEVAFDISADGLLHVSAKDLATQKEQKIRIDAKSGLSEDEVLSRIKDAERFAEEDKRKKETAEVRNEADHLCFRAEKSLRDYKDQISKEISKEIQERVDGVKKALTGADETAIRQATQALNQSMQHIGEELAKAQQAKGGENSSQPKAQSDEEPTEADVEIIDKDKENGE